MLTLFDIGGGRGGARCPYFWFPRVSIVTTVTSLSRSTPDLLKSSFHMFPYDEILKVFKTKIYVDI